MPGAVMDASLWHGPIAIGNGRRDGLVTSLQTAEARYPCVDDAVHDIGGPIDIPAKRTSAT